MVNFFSPARPQIMITFLNKFSSIFSKRSFISFAFYFSGLFLELKRTNIQTISQKTISAKYQNIQYFISDSNWNIELLNDKRILTIESNRTTKSCPNGALVLDDTGCKKSGFNTQGVQVQRLPSDGTQTKCNIVVFSAYSDLNKHFPINHKPYIPKNDTFFSENPNEYFKSKLELAQDLVTDALDKKIKFSDVIIDNWYFANDFIDFLQLKGLTFISEAEISRRISYHKKWTRADELVKLIPKDKFRWVTLSLPNGETKKFWTYSFQTKLKGLNGYFKIVVAIGKWNEEDLKGVHVLVSNHLKYSAFDILSKYALRWGIECIFRDLKENVAFDHYQVRSIKAISRHWHLAALAYTFLYWCKQNGYLSKNFSEKPKTMGDQLLLLRKLNSSTAVDWIIQNPESYQNFLGIKKTLRRAA